MGAVARRIRGSRVRRWALAAGGLTVLLAGCAKDAPQDTWKPEGSNAQKIQNLQWPVFMIAGIVGLIVLVAVIWCVFRYRDRGQAIPEQSHGNRRLEIALTILPALILAGVGVASTSTLMALSKTDDTQCVVNVTGQQWWWEIDYPVQEGCGGITEPIVTSGQLVIPADTNVLLRGTSRDVIHSFWVPKINGKRDMVPGRVQTLRLQAEHPGIYAGQCAEFCGLSHANMRMEIVSLSAEDFEAWKANQIADVEPAATGTLAAEGEALFVQQCARCHQVNGLVNSDGDPVIAHPQDQVYAGAAPNLTHLMSRNTFAGASLRPAHRGVPPLRLGRASGGVRRPLPAGGDARLPQSGQSRLVAAQRAGDETDVHQPDRARTDQRPAARHALPRPVRGSDRQAHRLSVRVALRWPSSNDRCRRPRRPRPPGCRPS